MHRLFNPLPWLIAAVVLVVAAAFLWLSGSAVVVDETDAVRSAVVADGHGREQPLHKLWNGYFYVIPNMEGTIEIRCASGETTQWGYVTPHVHTKVRVVGDTPCAKVTHAD